MGVLALAFYVVLFALFLVFVGLLLAAIVGGTLVVRFCRNEKPPLHRPQNISCGQSLPADAPEQTTCACGNLFVGPGHIGAREVV